MKQIQTVQGPLWVWDQDQVGAVLEGGAFWDWQLKPIIDEAAQKYPNRAAIDIGAAFGWFTIYLAGLFKLVYAVEAHPATAELLCMNLRERDLLDKKVLVQQKVAWDRRDYFAIAPAEQLGWPVPYDLNLTPNPSSLAFVPAAIGDVEGVAVDTLVPRQVPIGFIKIDAQGADLRAAVGLTKTIKKWKPWAVWEFEMGPSGWHGDTLQDYFDFWAGEGYQWEELPAQNYAVWPKGEREGYA